MKKHILWLLIVLSILTLFFCDSALAMETVASGNCGEEGDNVTWTLDDEGTLTISGTGKMKSFSDSIHAPWFLYNYSINNIIINNDVSTIGDYAFYDCSNLISVTIPESIIGFGYESFCGCSSLLSINVSEYNLFFSSIDGVLYNKNKTNLVCYPAGRSSNSYMIPDSVTRIGYEAFYCCFNLQSVTIPESVTYIDGYAFYCCTGISELILPNSITSIGVNAFSGSGLKSIKIPDNVTNMDGDVFWGCSNLENVTISRSITSIKSGTFCYCSSLENIALPDSVITIGDIAFANCIKLKTINIPHNVTDIGDCAFSGCTSLMTVTIPDSVITIGNEAFSYCPGLKSINVSIENDTYSSVDGILFDKNKTQIFVYPPCKTDTFYLIPDSVKVIRNFAFSGCKKLTNITIPKEVRRIESYAFSESGIKKIYMPGTEKITIDDTAFYGTNPIVYCYKSTQNENWAKSKNFPVFLLNHNILGLPQTLIEIDSKAFADLPAAEAIRIPDSVISIADDAFSGSNILILAPDGSYAITWAQDHGFDYLIE